MIEPHHILMAGRLSGVQAAPADARKTYYRSDKAYYAPSIALDRRGNGCYAEIMVSLAPPGGGTYGEYAVRFGRFANTPPQAAPWMRLEVFQDGLHALVNHADFLIGLAALSKALPTEPFAVAVAPTPEQVEALLQSLGYIDATQYTRDS